MDVEVRRTYKFRLYRNDKRDGHLHQQINITGLIWNHAVALQRRYYRLTGKYIGLGRLKQHIAKLRMKTHRYAFWRDLGSQAVQDVLERLDNAYQRFFAGLGFAQFVQIVEWVAFKRGKQVVLLDQWTQTTQTCSTCGEHQKLDLKERTFALGHRRRLPEAT